MILEVDFYFDYPARVQGIKCVDSQTVCLQIKYYDHLYAQRIRPEYECFVTAEKDLFKQVCKLEEGDIVWAEPANNHRITKVLHLTNRWKRFFSRWYRFER